eukprot:1628741-Prymnesium_polylepis.1
MADTVGQLALVAACSSDLAEFDVETRLRRYAARHGYSIHFAVPHHGEASFYQKPSTLRTAYATAPADVRWLWWIDCDTVILDEAVDARRLLAAALAVAGEPIPSFVASYETWGDHLGGHPINTGSLFIRRDDAGARLLAKWEHACKKKTNLVHINFNRDQTALTRAKGFVNVPHGARGCHRFFNSTAVALPDAPFNALTCPAKLRPTLGSVLVLHFARGTHSIGRCAPYYNPGRNASEFSKAALVRLALQEGIQSVWDRCCRCNTDVRAKALRAGDTQRLDEIFSPRECGVRTPAPAGRMRRK